MSFFGYNQWEHIVRSNLELFSVDQMNDTFTISIPVQTEKTIYGSVIDPVLRIVVTRMELAEKFVYRVQFYKGALAATNATPKFTSIGNTYYDESDVGKTMYAIKTILEYMVLKSSDPNTRYHSVKAVFGVLLSGIAKHSPSFGTRTENTVTCAVKSPKPKASHLKFILTKHNRIVAEYYLHRPVSAVEVIDETSGQSGYIEVYPNVVLMNCGKFVGSVFAAPVFILINMMHNLSDRYRALRSSMQSMSFLTTEIDNVRLYDIKDKTHFLTTTGGKITVSEKKGSTDPEKVKESYKMVKR